MSFMLTGGGQDPTPPHATPRGMDNGRRIGVVVRNLLYRNEIRGLDRVPATGPVLCVANHSAFMDGAVLFGCLPRRVSFLIKAEAVKGALGWLLTTVGQYALQRDVPDREPLLQALAQLKAGGAIGVFPEGTRGAGMVENVFNGAGLAGGPGRRDGRADRHPWRCPAGRAAGCRGSGRGCGCWWVNRSRCHRGRAVPRSTPPPRRSGPDSRRRSPSWTRRSADGKAGWR